jgi:hypothetical protein
MHLDIPTMRESCIDTPLNDRDLLAQRDASIVKFPVKERCVADRFTSRRRRHSSASGYGALALTAMTFHVSHRSTGT